MQRPEEFKVKRSAPKADDHSTASGQNIQKHQQFSFFCRPVCLHACVHHTKMYVTVPLYRKQNPVMI